MMHARPNSGNAGQGRDDPAEDTDADLRGEGGMGSGAGAGEEHSRESDIPLASPSNAASTAAEDGEEEDAAVGAGRASTSIFARMLERSQETAAAVGGPAAPTTMAPVVVVMQGTAATGVEVEEGGVGVVAERPHGGGSTSIFGRMLERAEQRAVEATAAPEAEMAADTEVAGSVVGGGGGGGQSSSSSIFGRMADVCVERAAAAAAARRVKHAGAWSMGAAQARGGEYVEDDSDHSDEEPLPMPITRWRMDMGAWPIFCARPACMHARARIYDYTGISWSDTFSAHACGWRHVCSRPGAWCSRQEWLEARAARGRALSKVGCLNESLVAVYCLAQYLSIAGL